MDQINTGTMKNKFQTTFMNQLNKMKKKGKDKEIFDEIQKNNITDPIGVIDLLKSKNRDGKYNDIINNIG